MTWVDGHRRLGALTALNRETTARYDACMANGGHVRSGEIARRDFGNHQRELPICSVCGVPFGGPRYKTAQVRWNGTRA